MAQNEDRSFWHYIAISIVLHIIVYLLFHFSLPHFKKEPVEEVMTFEVVPVREESNIKTQKHQKQEVKKEEKAKKQKKSKKADPKPAPKQEPKKQDPKPKEEKKPDPKPAPKKVEQVKKKDPPKPVPKPKKKVNHMEQLLKNLEKESQGKEERARRKAIEEKKSTIDDAIGKYKEKVPMSIGEIDYIRGKVVQNWNVPIGVKDAGEITVNLHINLNTDGVVEDVTLGSVNCPGGSDMACKAAVDSAIRAVKQASPFDQLKPDRYETWAEFKFNFDPQDALQ